MSTPTPTTPLVVPLSQLRRTDLPQAGGKAANLGALIEAGLPVPDGFCLTTAAYQALLPAGGPAVASALEALAAIPGKEAPTPELAEQVRAGAEAMRQAIERAPVPAAIGEAVAKAYAALGEATPVAVRSSATAEDLPDASFAGQQDTILNVVGAAAVLSAVQRCWGSLFTERAVSYRRKHGIDHREVALAVVVQRLVPSEVAGVLFTADPISGRRDVSVIDASPGLGEAVVSGAVNPDHFEVETKTGAVVSSRLGDKKVAIVAEEGGGTRRIDGEAKSAEACVTAAELKALAALGAGIEAHFGQPQDIEWAFGPGRALHVLQSRPITTLHPVPAGAPFPSDTAAVRVFFSFAVAQGVLRPMTPMGMAAWKAMVGAAQRFAGAPPADHERPPVVTDAALRLFLDVTPLLRSDLGRRAMSFFLSRMEARTGALMESLFTDARFAPSRTSRLWLLPRVLRVAFRTRVPLRLLAAMHNPAKARAMVQAAGDEALAAAPAGSALNAEQALAQVERLFSQTVRLTVLRAGPTFLAGMIALKVARRLLSGLATDVELDTVLRALPHNPTTEMDLELGRIAAALRHDEPSRAALTAPGVTASELAQAYLRGELPPRVQSELGGFLSRYGMRGVAEIDLGMARWREDPTPLLSSLMSSVAAVGGAGHDPQAQFEAGAAEAVAMIQTLSERARGRGWLRGRLVRFLLGRVRALCGVREAPKFHLVRVLTRARELLLQAGEALTASGRLSTAGGIFFLSFGEARQALAGADLKSIEAERRALYQRELDRKRLPRVLLSDGTDVQLPADPSSSGALRGTPASAGTVTGIARVVLDPASAQLKPGEILVAPSTDPGWTPLFLSASALVMEMGGAMSHGAVVAREYGIPAVVGVPGATERIHTGERIEVDGTRGVVVVLPASPAVTAP